MCEVQEQLSLLVADAHEVATLYLYEDHIPRAHAGNPANPCPSPSAGHF